MRTTVLAGIATLLASCLPALEPQPSLELEQLGSLIATTWDGVNGVPVEVLQDVECFEYWGECDPVLGHRAPGHEVSAMLRAFSATFQVPLVERSKAALEPPCPWSETQGTDKVRGLQAQFLQPQVVADSARVVVFSGCAAADRRMSGFRQAHEFVFSRDENGVWTLVSHQLVYIT